MSRAERRARLRQRVRQILGRVPLWAWTLVCLAVAALYVVVWPSEAASADPTSLRFIIVRWFHPLAWLLLAASCVIRMLPFQGRAAVANRVALLAAPAYAAFFLMVVTG